ncbi:MAG: hypothetical protein MUD12_15895 [Spirochaetes bacterium]|jgi:hypothetical protein|nr:hypothetical protein [Spirochaetota bacterium]
MTTKDSGCCGGKKIPDAFMEFMKKCNAKDIDFMKLKEKYMSGGKCDCGAIFEKMTCKSGEQEKK